MHPAQTVISRFVVTVTDLLRQRGADGAARHVWQVGAIFEPADRPHRREHERQRLLLLADRAARVWAPSIGATMRDRRLDEIVRQQPPIRCERDAADAARRVGVLRELGKTSRGASPSRSPDDVRQALAYMQKALGHVATGDPENPNATAVIAVPAAASGLVSGFLAGGGFSDGIPGEVRATVAVLDALDDERTISWGTESTMRTAGESDLHRSLVRSLMSTLALEAGEITHAEDGGPLPQPLVVGRHRPNLAGQSAHGGLFIGEAKLGPELFDDHTQEQLADFLSFAADNDFVGVHLIVPQGWRSEAQRAAVAAAGDAAKLLVIHQLGGLTGTPPPPNFQA